MQESNQEFLTWEAADGRVALLKVGERSKHDVFFLTVVSFPNAGNAWDILILIDLRNFLDTNPCIYINMEYWNTYFLLLYSELFHIIWLRLVFVCDSFDSGQTPADGLGQ